MTEVTTYAAPAVLGRFQRDALIVGIIGSVLCIAGWLIHPVQFFQSYLIGYLFWLGIVLGCLAIVMLQHLTGGDWGLVIQRLLESATRTLPLMAVLFFPLILGMNKLYTWSRSAAGEEAGNHQDPWLSAPFFLLRAGLYFAIWIVMAHFLNRWSHEQDRDADPQLKRRLQVLSGPGLIIYGLTATFAAVDWLMSLVPDWYSTIFGLLAIGSQVLSAMAFAVAVAALLAEREPMNQVFSTKHFHDLGKLLLAFVMIWAYLSFSQLLIVWAGNLPEEISFYLPRMQTSWRWIGVLLIVFQFALPFLLLLSRELKRHAKRLIAVAALVIAMRFIDLLWLVAPEFHRGGFKFHWLDLVAVIALGGIWLAFYLWQLRRWPLLPLNDPRLETALAHNPSH
jgi:hypothetical protein